MLTRRQILELIPHQGTMCLLDDVAAWSAADIACVASSHLAPDNPLRRRGRLSAICGVEYGLQAAALHGRLLHGAPARGAPVSAVSAAGGPLAGAPAPGFLAALRDVTLHVAHLDDQAFGALRVTARAEIDAPSGAIYRFAVASEAGTPLVEGRGTIAFATAAA